ncbi:MAG: hypothetical protein ACNA7K_05070 [Acholeplasmataceae bacterium]
MKDNFKNYKISMTKHKKNIDLSIFPIFLVKITKKNTEKDKLKFHESPKIYPRRSHLVKRSFSMIVLHKKESLNKKTDKSNQQSHKPILPGVKAWKKKSPKDRLKWVGFFVIIAIALINTVYMTARFIDNDYQYNLFRYANIEAVMPNQDITEPLRVGIVLIREIDFNQLDIGDQVVVCCDYDLNDTNWVETVVSINHETQTLFTTYDGLFSLSTPFDDVYGRFVDESGFFGTLYYSATFVRGYALISLSQLLIIYGYFYVVIKRRKDRLF